MSDELTPAFEDTPSKLTLGQYLVSVRESRNLSIKIVAQRTKISTTNLTYLEEDNYQALPNKAYLVGFVRSYAKIVGADEAHALKLLDEALGSDQHDEKEIKNLKKLAPGESRIPAPAQRPANEGLPLGKIVLGTFGVLILAIIVVFLNNDAPPSAPIADAIVEPYELGAKTPLKQPESTVAVEPPAETLTTDQIEYSPAQPSVVTPVKVPETTEKPQDLNITFRDITAPLSRFQSISDDELNRYYPRERRAPLVDGQQVVYINAIEGDTWITIKVDQEEIRRFILSEGRYLIIQGEVIRLFLGNVNATRIFVNNQLIDPMSRTGVKSLVFPDEARSRFKLPLFVYPADGVVLTSDEYIESQGLND
jgi:cytoskeleton protein RodZ